MASDDITITIRTPEYDPEKDDRWIAFATWDGKRRLIYRGEIGESRQSVEGTALKQLHDTVILRRDPKTGVYPYTYAQVEAIKGSFHLRHAKDLMEEEREKEKQPGYLADRVITRAKEAGYNVYSVEELRRIEFEQRELQRATPEELEEMRRLGIGEDQP